MAEIPPITIRLNEDGIEQVAAIVAHLKQRNDELARALTAVQEVSTQQVERIRLLEAELNELKSRMAVSHTLVGPSGA